MKSIWFMLRVGNVLRFVLASHIIASIIVILARPETGVTVLAFVAASVVAVVSSLVIGAREASVLRAWERAAVRAANEDFAAPMTHNVPTTWLPLRNALELSRDRLSDSLERAREEKAVLVSMLNAMTEGVIAIDANARIILVNRVALSVLGVAAMQSPEEYEGEHLVKLARDPRVNELVDRVLASGRAMRDETEIHATRKMCSLSAAPVIENGRVRGVVIAISDRTALKQLERVRQDFVTNVSHELKTPIAAIRGWAETLNSGAFDVPEALQDPIEIIYRQSERLSDLVEDVMTLARVESMGVSETHELIDIEEVVSEAERALEEKLRERDIRIDRDFGADARVVPTSGRALHYIVRNLVDNAVKYSHRGGSVRVSTLRDVEQRELIVEVSDTGAGIERHHLARVFERFYRIDSGRSRAVGGTGLGLAIVKHFATALGGRVEVDSEVDVGSTFRVILPERTPRAPEAEATALH